MKEGIVQGSRQQTTQEILDAYDEELRGGVVEGDADNTEDYTPADVVMFPELSGWYYHPIDGWVEGEKTPDASFVSKGTSFEGVDAPMNLESEQAQRFLGLLDESAWVGRNGTLEGEQILHNFSYKALCDTQLERLTSDGERELAIQLETLCTPSCRTDSTQKSIRVMDEMLHYMRYLVDDEKDTQIRILTRALTSVAQSRNVSYTSAKRAEQILAYVRKWSEHGEYGKRHTILEEWNDRALITIAPNLVGHYGAQDIYIPSDPQHPDVLDKRLGVGDLFIVLDENRHDTYERADTVLNNYYYMRAPDTFRTLPPSVRHCLNTLSLPEQAQVVQFMQSRTVDDFGAFESFISTHKTTGARTFLSLEQKDGMGDKILSIAQNAGPEFADKIFSTYSTMVEEVEHVTEKLVEQYSDEKINVSLIHTIVRDILRDGATLLESYAGEFTRAEGNNLGQVVARCVEQLTLFNQQAHLTATTFARLKEQFPDLSLEELASVDIKEVRGSDIAPEQLQEMRAIYDENYKDYPPEFRDVLQVKLSQRIDDGTRFHIVSDKETGTIMSFMTFSDQEDGSVYFASNNTNPWLMGKRIGGAFMNTKIPYEGTGRRMDAHCVPSEPITQKYLNELGFVGTGTDMVGGVELLAIVRDEEMLAGLQSKAMTLGELRAGTLPSLAYVVQEEYSTPFTFAPHEEGDVLTKMFVADGKRHVVYEKPSRPLVANGKQ